MIQTSYNRRSFFKVSATAGGGMLLGFNWLASSFIAKGEPQNIPLEAFEMNGFIQIDTNGLVTIFSPNPEIGQNVKTSMPMIVAEELDVDWKNVLVKQAPLNTQVFTRQIAGGSQSIRLGWKSLRMAGATAKQMLVEAAAQKWKVSPTECTVSNGIITHSKGQKISYGEIIAEAIKLEIPKEIKLKDPKDFKLIGQNIRNVDLPHIITGKPLFGLDYKADNMLIAVVMRPPAFGQKLDTFDDSETRKINGVKEVVKFGDKIAVIATHTWAALKGKKTLKATWKEGSKLENTTEHDKQLLALLNTPSENPKRKDGDVKKAFEEADEIVEKTFEGPFMPHNCLEPMNFFANVTNTKVELVGPIQTPEATRKQVAELLKREESQISLEMTRMGGGFGRRLRGDFALEAAEISSLVKKPIKVVFSREDDMTAGLYRPASKYKFKVAIKNNQVTAYHLVGAGTNGQNFTREHNFPAGAFENYQIESHNLDSNITIAPWRAPITNFLAFAEQSFLDEVAYKLGKDPIQFRLGLLEKAKASGAKFDYDVDKYIGVIRLAQEKSGWGLTPKGIFQGFSAYYSHNTYVAEVAEVVMRQNQPIIQKVICAIDCGIVINPIAALNQIEGGIIDGIGHALFGDLSFVEGVPQSNNFNKFRLIKMSEAPKVETHFVQSLNDPTGLGEPTLPPVGAAVANAIFAATGKRLYKMPFIKDFSALGGS